MSGNSFSDPSKLPPIEARVLPPTPVRETDRTGLVMGCLIAGGLGFAILTSVLVFYVAREQVRTGKRTAKVANKVIARSTFALKKAAPVSDLISPDDADTWRKLRYSPEESKQFTKQFATDFRERKIDLNAEELKSLQDFFAQASQFAAATWETHGPEGKERNEEFMKLVDFDRFSERSSNRVKILLARSKIKDAREVSKINSKLNSIAAANPLFGFIHNEDNLIIAARKTGDDEYLVSTLSETMELRWLLRRNENQWRFVDRSDLFFGGWTSSESSYIAVSYSITPSVMNAFERDLLRMSPENSIDLNEVREVEKSEFIGPANDEEYRRLVCATYVRFKEWDSVVNVFKQSGVSDYYPINHYFVAAAHLSLGRASEAMQAAERFLELAGRSPRASRIVAQSAEQLGDHAKARAAWLAILELRPHDTAALVGFVKATIDCELLPRELAKLEITPAAALEAMQGSYFSEEHDDALEALADYAIDRTKEDSSERLELEAERLFRSDRRSEAFEKFLTLYLRVRTVSGDDDRLELLQWRLIDVDARRAIAEIPDRLPLFIALAEDYFYEEGYDLDPSDLLALAAKCREDAKEGELDFHIPWYEAKLLHADEDFAGAAPLYLAALAACGEAEERKSVIYDYRICLTNLGRIEEAFELEGSDQEAALLAVYDALELPRDDSLLTRAIEAFGEKHPERNETAGFCRAALLCGKKQSEQEFLSIIESWLNDHELNDSPEAPYDSLKYHWNSLLEEHYSECAITPKLIVNENTRKEVFKLLANRFHRDGNWPKLDELFRVRSGEWLNLPPAYPHQEWADRTEGLRCASFFHRGNIGEFQKLMNRTLWKPSEDDSSYTYRYIPDIHDLWLISALRYSRRDILNDERLISIRSPRSPEYEDDHVEIEPSPPGNRDDTTQLIEEFQRYSELLARREISPEAFRSAMIRSKHGRDMMAKLHRFPEFTALIGGEEWKRVREEFPRDFSAQPIYESVHLLLKEPESTLKKSIREAAEKTFNQSINLTELPKELVAGGNKAWRFRAAGTDWFVVVHRRTENSDLDESIAEANKQHPELERSWKEWSARISISSAEYEGNVNQRTSLRQKFAAHLAGEDCTAAYCDQTNRIVAWSEKLQDVILSAEYAHLVWKENGQFAFLWFDETTPSPSELAAKKHWNRYCRAAAGADLFEEPFRLQAAVSAAEGLRETIPLRVIRAERNASSGVTLIARALRDSVLRTEIKKGELYELSQSDVVDFEFPWEGRTLQAEDFTSSSQ